MKSDHTSDRDLNLINRIRRGDKAAFEILFRSHYSNLCRFAYRYVHDSDISEDVVETVFLNIWQNRTNWLPKSSIRAYLFKSIKNHSLNYIKSTKNFSEIDLDRQQNLFISPVNIQAEFERNELINAVQQAIEFLPPRCKLIFVLNRQDDLKYSEIADILDISVKTVETQMGKALKILRKLLKPYLTLLSFIPIVYSALK